MEWRTFKQVGVPSLSESSPSLLTCPSLRRTSANWWLGGGIVFDSDEYEEWVETINKLGANMQCITSAEDLYHQQQQAAKGLQ